MTWIGGYSLDNSGQKQGERVDGTEACHTNQHEDVDFPVADGLPDVFDVEVV
jgi:hypothetical protein